jgi:hypothetical protein
MRFTGRDPVDGDYEEPLSLHKYLYCENDPIDWIDPSGESLEGVLAANEIHNAAVDIACYGVENDKLDYIDLATDLENEKGAIAQASSYWVAPMAIDAIIRCAIKWLGPCEIIGGENSWNFRSLRYPERQVRMSNDDLDGKHSGGKKHVNFDVYERDSSGRVTDVTKIHIPILDSGNL